MGRQYNSLYCLRKSHLRVPGRQVNRWWLDLCQRQHWLARRSCLPARGQPAGQEHGVRGHLPWRLSHHGWRRALEPLWRRPSLCGGGRHLHGAGCLLPAHRELWPRCLGNPSIKRNSTFCSSAVPFGTALPVLLPGDSRFLWLSGCSDRDSVLVLPLPSFLRVQSLGFRSRAMSTILPSAPSVPLCFKGFGSFFSVPPCLRGEYSRRGRDASIVRQIFPYHVRCPRSRTIPASFILIFHAFPASCLHIACGLFLDQRIPALCPESAAEHAGHARHAARPRTRAAQQNLAFTATGPGNPCP